MSIIVKHLSFVYNPNTPFAKKALNDINLVIEDGDFFGIIGHTGSGKSTLVQHFNALIKPSRGNVRVDGMDPAEKGADLRELRSNVGMVFQYPEYQLFAETVFDDVAFGFRNYYKRSKKELKRDPDRFKAETEERVREAITMVGFDYEKIKDKSPFDLSGGQKRRVAIAGVIVMRPKILVLDEPTAGLDPRGKAEILRLLHELKKNYCPTIVMISHNMNEIASNCNKIAVISEGKIICVRSPQELFSDDELIREKGIEVPEAVRLFKLLRQKGISFDRLPFNAEEAAGLLFERLKEEGKYA